MLEWLSFGKSRFNKPMVTTPQRRTIGTISLLFTSVSAIMGSGWLFSSFYTSKLAGPASLVAWCLGGLLILIVAFTYAEICALIPVSGSSARIPYYTHGTIVSFIFAWLNWLAYLALMAIEVQAILQYADFYFPSLTDIQTGSLSEVGYCAATGLMLFVAIINTYSLRWLVACNNALTLVKIFIPVLLSVVILVLYFSPTRTFHTAGSTFMPQGWHGIMSAVAVGGIVFSFNGFKQAAEMAGEVSNPGKSVPIAIIGSITLCLALFLLLQLGFLNAIAPQNIANGWQQLTIGHNMSPYADILAQSHLGALLPVMYIGAIIAPLAASMMYSASAARSLYGLSKNRQVPMIFSWLSRRYNPVPAIIFNFIAGMLLFAPLPGWDKMMGFLSSILAVTYAIGPINLLALRHQLPNQYRPIRLPFVQFWAWAAFTICTLLTYWSGWDTLWKLLLALLIGYIILLVYRSFCKDKPALNAINASWLWLYLLGLGAIAYVGDFGGHQYLQAPWDYLAIAVLCTICLGLAMRFKLPAATTQKLVESIEFDGKTIL